MSIVHVDQPEVADSARHLKTLKDAGLVTDRREGRWVYYALNPDAITLLEALHAMRPERPGFRDHVATLSVRCFGYVHQHFLLI